MNNNLIKKTLLDGIIDSVISDSIVLKRGRFIKLVGAKDFDCRDEVEKRSEKLAYLYSNSRGFFHHVIGLSSTDILYWKFGDDKQVSVGNHSDLFLHAIYCDEPYLYLRGVSSGKCFEFNMETSEIRGLCDKSFTNTPVVVNDKIYAMSGSCCLDCYSLSGSLVWSCELAELARKNIQLTEGLNFKVSERVRSVESKIIFHVDPYRLFCVSSEDGRYLWDIDDAVDFNWCIGHDNYIYSVRNGMLKTISSTDGSLVSDKEIDCDWIQSEKIGLNLFQVSYTDAHLICGFLGHGLCAINLKTAKVDWHEFDGMTCNRTPIIKNNRIYAQMKGGIEFGGGRGQEYVLEGVGGYMGCPDNRFKFI